MEVALYKKHFLCFNHVESWKKRLKLLHDQKAKMLPVHRKTHENTCYAGYQIREGKNLLIQLLGFSPDVQFHGSQEVVKIIDVVLLFNFRGMNALDSLAQVLGE